MTVQSSKLSSMFPKKKPTAQSSGLSKGTAKAWATALPDPVPTVTNFSLPPVNLNTY